LFESRRCSRVESPELRSLVALRVPPAVLVLVAAFLMWGVSRVAPTPGFQGPVASVVASFFAAVGTVSILLGVATFRRAGTTVNPTAPHRASTLVRGGIYQVSRNPMYLGFALVLLGWGFLLESWLSLLAVPGFVLYLNRYQIEPEERALEDRFGEEYRDYARSVRRWI
jgi:protein-S-isoprenylcysteine O-methyltransferase Ste14